jgi:hypothetical protein
MFRIRTSLIFCGSPLVASMIKAPALNFSPLKRNCNGNGDGDGDGNCPTGKTMD